MATMLPPLPPRRTGQLPPPPAESPSRNDGVTIACALCGRRVPRVGRQRFCSAVCRQAAFRRRHQPPAVATPLPPPAAPRAAGTVYECPACGQRLLSEQRCPECNVFCRRVGPGGRCPHCDEPVALADLLPAG